MKGFHINRASVLGIVVLLAAACAPVAQPPPTPVPASAPTAVVPPAGGPPRPTASQPSPTPVPSAGSPRSSTPTPAVPQPRYGGDLTQFLASDPPSLDGNAENTAATYDPSRAAYDSLLNRDDYDPKRPLVPRLASSWDVSADGKVLTFKLRPGIMFHDGSPLTSADVQFTIARYGKPPEGVRSAIVPALAPIERVETPDPLTVRIVTTRPVSAMLDRLAQLNINSKAWVEAKHDPRKEMMGTGPFKFDKYAPGSVIRFTKNSKFWQEGRPYLDSLSWFIVPDGSTRMASLKTGRVLAATTSFVQLSPEEKTELNQDKPEIKTFPATTQLAGWTIINMRNPPLSDARVRRALHLAIDRQQGIKLVYQGAGDVGFWLRGPGLDWGMETSEIMALPGFRADKTQDRADAKKLLAEAGYANGFSTTLVSRTPTFFRNTALYIADQLATIGVKVKVDVQDDAAISPRGRRGEFDMLQYATTNGIRGSSDPADQLGIYFLPGGGLNFQPYDDASFQQTFARMEAEFDMQKKNALARTIQEKLLEDMPGLFMTYSHGFLAISGAVRDFPEGVTEFHRGHLERIWLAQ